MLVYSKTSMTTQIIAIANQKGGVGKTTTTISLAAALAKMKQRVLCVDLDPQGALTASTVGEETGAAATLYEVLGGYSELVDAIVPFKEGFDVVVGSVHLSGAEIELAQVEERHSQIARILKGVDYEIVLIDCPPSLGMLAVNALSAAQWVLIPVAAEFLALRGLAMLIDAIERVQEGLNPDLKILGILPTLYEGRTLHAQEVVGALRERFEKLVFRMPVKRTVRFRETPIAQSSILSYAPESEGAKAYTKLAKEVMERVKARIT